MDSLPSHPFADLFALLSPDSIPKWTSVVDLVRRLSAIEHQLGEDAVTEWLEKLENARDLLSETEEQLVELYFDRDINDLAAEASALAIGEVHTPGDQDPELALGEVTRQRGSEVEYEQGNAEVELCLKLMEVVDLAEAVSGQGSEVHDLDIEECENADIHIASHQAAGNSGQAIEVVHDLHIEECEKAHIQAASHQDDGISGQAGGVECEGIAEVEICQTLKCAMDWDEAADGQANEGHDVDIEESEMAFVEVAKREDSASHQFEGASGQAGEDGPDIDEGKKDVEMS